MKLLIELLSKAYNLDAERIAEILFKKADDGTITDDIREEAIAEILELDKSRIQTVKAEAKGAFDNGYKKAQKEVAEAWEKSIREKFGVQTEATGEQLLAEILEAKSQKGKPNDDTVKTHPLFLELERKYIQDLEAAKKEGMTALEQYKAEQAAINLRNAAKAKAKEILLAKKPVLEEDQLIAETRISDFLRELDQFDFQEDNGGFLPTQGGKRLENDHSHPIGFNDLVEQIASRRFKFQVQNPKDNGGNKNDPGPNKQPVVLPDDESQLWEQYQKAKSAGDTATLEAIKSKLNSISV